MLIVAYTLEALTSRWRAVVGLIAALIPTGCAFLPTNPSFPVSTNDARRDLRRMSAVPRPLVRPLVVVGGFIDPGIAAVSLKSKFARLFRDRRIVAVPLGGCLSIGDCRTAIVRAVDTSFPSDVPDQTVEVDVIGYSLGGLAARYAALQTSGAAGRRLRIARLFTISTPHQGADQARRLPLLHPLQSDLRPDSPLVGRVNSAESSYPVFPYVRLGDRAVGAANAAPPGRVAWWVPNEPLSDAHNGAYMDARIIADIARRLRTEEPWSTDPPAALPVP